MRKMVLMGLSALFLMTAACGDKKDSKPAGPRRVNAKEYPAQSGTPYGAWAVPMQGQGSFRFDAVLFINPKKLALEVTCADDSGKTAIAIVESPLQISDTASKCSWMMSRIF